MEKQKAPPPVAEINVTPMVDVMLVLLIIFMVITPMLTKGQPIDLVRTHNPITMQAADKEDAVLISVTRNSGLPGSSEVTNCRAPWRMAAATLMASAAASPYFFANSKASRPSSWLSGSSDLALAK